MGGRVDPIVRWILESGANLELESLASQLGERLAARAGVDRLFTATLSLHPIAYGQGVVRNGDGSTRIMSVGWDIARLQVHHESPISTVMETGEELRIRIDGGPYPYALLEEFEEQGLTDWIGLPLSQGPWTSVLALSTRQPGGYTEEQVAFLREVALALAPVSQVLALRRTAESILNTYLGPHAGARVWRGQIQKGDGVDLHAVIWFCDLRHSTPLADRLPREAFLALLDGFFEAMAGAVQDGGGEVLRYIGDAVLGIFPIDDPADPGPAVQAAVAAARDASARMRALNDERAERDEEPLEYGIGLHLGDVMYGNIGTTTRLEFSVIGAAANEAARVEAMCKELGCPVIVSDAVATWLADGTESLGKHRLRGVSREVELFALTGVAR